MSSPIIATQEIIINAIFLVFGKPVRLSTRVVGRLTIDRSPSKFSQLSNYFLLKCFRDLERNGPWEYNAMRPRQNKRFPCVALEQLTEPIEARLFLRHQSPVTGDHHYLMPMFNLGRVAGQSDCTLGTTLGMWTVSQKLGIRKVSLEAEIICCCNAQILISKALAILVEIVGDAKSIFVYASRTGKGQEKVQE